MYLYNEGQHRGVSLILHGPPFPLHVAPTLYAFLVAFNSMLLLCFISQCINTLALDRLLLRTPPKSNSLQSWLLTSGKPLLCVLKCTFVTEGVKTSGKLLLYCVTFPFGAQHYWRLHHQHHQTTEDVSGYHSQSYFFRCLHGDRGIRLLL